MAFSQSNEAACRSLSHNCIRHHIYSSRACSAIQSLLFWHDIVAWSREVDCPYCKNELQRNGLACPRCGGHGLETIRHRGWSIELGCPLCHGMGRISKNSQFLCPYCNVDLPRLFQGRIHMSFEKLSLGHDLFLKAQQMGTRSALLEKGIIMAM